MSQPDNPGKTGGGYESNSMDEGEHMSLSNDGGHESDALSDVTYSQPDASSQDPDASSQDPDASSQGVYIADEEIVTPSTVTRGDLHKVAEEQNKAKRRSITDEQVVIEKKRRIPAAGAGGPGHDDDGSMSGASTATNLSVRSQASIDSIASSVAESIASSVASGGLPLPDAELMLIEFVGGVYRLTVYGREWFNMVAENAGGYGPIASIAFISLLAAKPNLLPTMDLTRIASQIGLTAPVANAAVEAAAAAAANAPATTGIFSSLTGAAASAAASAAAAAIGNGIAAGVTAIAATIATNDFVANPLTTDHIASMIESAGNKGIKAGISFENFKKRMVISFEKLKANWTVQNLRVEGISIRQKENIDALVGRAVDAHRRVLDPPEGEPPMTVEQLTAVYTGIINNINAVAPTGDVPVIAEGDNVDRIRDDAADALIANAAPADNADNDAPADDGTIGGKKNRKSQKKPRKKVTKSKRGKKAARKTKKQSRRKSRGKKHGKSHGKKH